MKNVKKWAWVALCVISIIYVLAHFPLGAAAPVYGDF